MLLFWIDGSMFLISNAWTSISASQSKPTGLVTAPERSSDQATFTLPDDHPGESGDRCPGRPTCVNPHILTLATVHALHTAADAKNVANIAPISASSTVAYKAWVKSLLAAHGS